MIIVKLGSLAIGIRLFDYDEFIVNDIYSAIKIIKANKKLKYKIIHSDPEFNNNYLIVYKKNTILAKIYNGKGYCYPQINKNGSYILLMKYILLHSLNPREQKLTKYIFNYMIKRQNELQNKIFIDDCSGINISLYRKYYLKNWNKKPWNYIKNIKVT